MFATLVVVLPSAHKGGRLLLRHKDREFMFDSSDLLQGKPNGTVAFVAFYSDVEHEVEKVTSGHRVTLTYNLYCGSDDDDVDPVNVGKIEKRKNHVIEPLRQVLQDPEILPKGGYLGFGLRYEYPMRNNHDFSKMHIALKGSDAMIYEACEEVGLSPKLQLIYGGDNEDYICDGIFNPDAEIVDLNDALQDIVDGIPFTTVVSAVISSCVISNRV